MRDIKKKCVRGSSVVEMSYIMPLFLGIFVLIMHTVFFYHDKAVLNGAAAETAVLGAQAERREGTEYDLESFFTERTAGKLIYMTDVGVTISVENEKIEVSASARRNFMRLEIRQRAMIVNPEERIRWMR